MKKRILLILALVGLTTAVFAQSPEMKMTTPIPESITTPENVQTSIGALKFFDGVPTGKTTETVYDCIDRARAVEVFLNAMPVV
ncbi:hypothetical protein C6A37_12740, partial [Desulfobacteraceae bacterium SEEP-SAG9]